MGVMGRAFDGGYVEYRCVPVGQVVAFDPAGAGSPHTTVPPASSSSPSDPH